MESVALSRSKLSMYLDIRGKLAEDITAAQIENVWNYTMKSYTGDDVELHTYTGRLNVVDDNDEDVNTYGIKGGTKFLMAQKFAAGTELPKSVRLQLYDYATDEYGDATTITFCEKAE